MCAGNQQEVSWLHQWMYRTCVCLWAQQSGSMRKSAIFVASSPQDIHSGKPVRDHIFDAAQVTHTGSSKWPRGGEHEFICYGHHCKIFVRSCPIRHVGHVGHEGWAGLDKDFEMMSRFGIYALVLPAVVMSTSWHYSH